MLIHCDGEMIKQKYGKQQSNIHEALF